MKIVDDAVYGPIRIQIVDEWIAAGSPLPKENWLYSRLVEARFKLGAAFEAGRGQERNEREDRRERLHYVRNLFDLSQELASQHFQLGGTHADNGALNCDCDLAKSHQKTYAEWRECSEALRSVPAPPDSGDKVETKDKV